MPTGHVASHFLDSGSFTLWTRAAKYHKENRCGRWDFYETEEFWTYIDQYAEFVKKYKDGIDLYSNMDVIPNPELSFRNLTYLEDEHGLQPVPVVHYTTDLKWLERYIKRDHPVIALGGLVGSATKESCWNWLDKAFDIICASPDRLPRVRVHGFGVTSFSLMRRFPWWSVDSTSWTKIGAFGGILVPKFKGGKFIFDDNPNRYDVSMEGRDIVTLNRGEEVIIRKWLEVIGIPFGKIDRSGEIQEVGITTNHSCRRAANLLFFEEFCKSLKPYPWAFRIPHKPSFGLL